MSARVARLMLPALIACAPGKPAVPAVELGPPGAELAPAGTSTEPAPEVERFTATVRIVDEDRTPGAKRFHGVMLEREDGAKWVAQYGVDALWRSFADARVVVEGQRVEPQGQALVAVHFRVGPFRHAERRREGRPVDFFEVSEERRMRGRFRAEVGAVGTKSEGEPFLTFVPEDGRPLRVFGATTDLPRDRDVTVAGRVIDIVQLVTITAVGGPHLFVVAVESSGRRRDLLQP